MTTPEPSFSKDVVDAGSLSQRLDPLLASNGGRWALTNGGEALERTFKFKTFAKTWVSCSRSFQFIESSDIMTILFPRFLCNSILSCVFHIYHVFDTFGGR